MTKTIKTTLFILGLIMLSISVVNIFIANFNFGNIIVCVASCVLISYGLFYEKLIRIKWLTYCIVSVSAFFLVMMILIGFYGKIDNTTFTEDAVVVLGAGIRGEQVSRLLSYRLDKAAEYIAVNPQAVIIVSGGQGPQEDITEATAMERYLIDTGIPKEKIIKEEAATSTYENLLYSKEILDEMFAAPYKIVIITNDFHIFRAEKLAEKLGLNANHYNAKTEWYSIPLNYSRECFAIFKFWMLGK